MDRKTKSLVIISLSLSVLIVCMFFSAITYIGYIRAPLTWIDFLVIGILSFICPVGFYIHGEQKRIKKIEEKLPDFLRDIAEAGRFGMTLASAIKNAAKGKYGLLTPEIKKMADQISWGVSATEALKLFAERVDTPLVHRVCGIVIKASNAGGNVADILTLVSIDAREGQIAEEERRVAMTTYLAVIYIAFFVFLATVLILNTVFIPQMESVSKAPAGVEGGQAVKPIQAEAIPEIRMIYLWAAIIHGLGDGILAGVIIDGTIASGMRHSFFMVLMGFLLLRVLVV